MKGNCRNCFVCNKHVICVFFFLEVAETERKINRWIKRDWQTEKQRSEREREKRRETGKNR